jgi:hypothetical protein
VRESARPLPKFAIPANFKRQLASARSTLKSHKAMLLEFKMRISRFARFHHRDDQQRKRISFASWRIRRREFAGKRSELCHVARLVKWSSVSARSRFPLESG